MSRDDAFSDPSIAGMLRAVRADGALTIERRTGEGPWEPLTFGDVVSLGATGGPVAAWLTRVGVPYGGATGKDYRAVARFRVGGQP